MDIFDECGSSDDSTYNPKEMESNDIESVSNAKSTNSDEETEQPVHIVSDKETQPINCSDIVVPCSVCLGIESDDINEIIFCDKCGYTVHEECYGVEKFYHKDEDNSRTPSVESDNPTELWFCERCSSNETMPLSCELCPNTENVGLLKRTDDERWVHHICSLFTPGVSYHDTDNLWPVCLSEIPQKVFGQKVCSLCSDISFSRTGICMTCDVGLCNVSAHAGCAYQHGLLHFDYNNSADAYLFYCKQHSSKEVVKERLSRIHSCQQFARQIQQLQLCKDDQLRQDRLFAMNKRHYHIREARFIEQNNSSTEVCAKSRPLTSSSLVMKMFAQREKQLKEERLNNTHDFERDNLVPGLDLSDNEGSDGRVVNSREPAFTANFVTYYNAREQEIADDTKRLDLINQEIEKIHTQEKDILKIVDELDDLRRKHNAMIICNKFIIAAASKVLNGEISNPLMGLSLEPLMSQLPLTVDQSTLDRIAICDICQQRCYQDSMCKCHVCNRSYHIFCLDPPLENLPQLRSGNALYGWECALCTHEASKGWSSSDVVCQERPNDTPAMGNAVDETLPRRGSRKRRCRKLSF